MARNLPPIHPGEVLREEFLVPLNLSAGALAKACGFPRTRIDWAVTVRANWRIIFRFANAKASDVDFVDYH